MPERAPTDRLEAEAWLILAAAAGVPRSLGAADNFFDAGGDRARAAAVARELSRLYRVPVGADDISSWPLAGELTVQLRSRMKAERSRPRPPVTGAHVLILPHEADAAAVRSLDPGLRRRLNLSVVPPPVDDVRAYRTLGTICEQLLGDLADPAGVRLVVGFCSATPVAYEVARMLAVDRAEPPGVLLIDATCGPVAVANLKTVLNTHQPETWLSRLAQRLPAAYRVSGDPPLVRLADRAGLAPLLAELVHDNILDLVGLAGDQVSGSTRERLAVIHMAYLRQALAGCHYDYPACPGLRVTVGIGDGDSRALAYWSGKDVQLVVTPNRHHDLVADESIWSAALAVIAR
jgi:hypothetical protein